MHIAICDDDLCFANALSCWIKDYFSQHDLAYSSLITYTDGYTLLSDYATDQVLDILFLDIDLSIISGIEVAHQLRLAHSEALIVFVTSHPEFMLTTFQVEAFDFLTKPVTADDVAHVLKRCVRKYQQGHGKIAIKSSNGMVVVYLHKLLYVASDKHYLNFVFTDQTTIRSLLKLSQLEERLHDFPQFIRCHQSYLVNLDYIAEIERESVLFSPKYHDMISSLPISRKYAAGIREKFMRYHF